MYKRQALPDSAGLDADSGLRVQTQDGRVHVDPEVVQIGNNQYEYRNVRTSGTRPRLDSGQLGIELIDYDSRSELEQVITGVASGHVASAERDGLLARWTAESLTVEGSSGVVHAGVDGEYLTLPSPLVMSCQHGALRVRVPTDRPGLPAPLPTSSVATLRALWSLAGGRPA